MYFLFSSEYYKFSLYLQLLILAVSTAESVQKPWKHIMYWSKFTLK